MRQRALIRPHILLLVLSLLSVVGGCYSAGRKPDQERTEKTLTLGTFNVEWFGDGINDRKPRTEEDLMRLAETIRRSGVDILGLQEVENRRALERLLRFLPEFTGFVGSLGGQQNLALLYRRGLKVQVLGEYTPLMLQPGRTRPGLLAYCQVGKTDFYLMVVHLKSTSRYDSTEQMRQLSRQLRLLQVQHLVRWVDSLYAATSERDVVIVGDFNDTPRRKQYPTLTPLVEHPELVFVTEHLRSCRYARAYTIDHIVVSRSFARRYHDGSAQVVNVYARYPFEQAERLSDHCPVVAQFDVTFPDHE